MTIGNKVQSKTHNMDAKFEIFWSRDGAVVVEAACKALGDEENETNRADDDASGEVFKAFFLVDSRCCL